MRRTQIYLDSDLHRALSEQAREEGITLSEVIRRRLRSTLAKERLVDRVSAFKQAVGVWKDRDDLTDTEGYLRRLRKNNRAKRHGVSGAKNRR